MAKYITFKDETIEMLSKGILTKGSQIVANNHTPVALIFSEGFTHSEIFERLKAIYGGLVPVGAGFCHNTDEGWVCYGKSESIKLGPNSNDEYMLDAEFGLKKFDDIET